MTYDIDFIEETDQHELDDDDTLKRADFLRHYQEEWARMQQPVATSPKPSIIRREVGTIERLLDLDQEAYLVEIIHVVPNFVEPEKKEWKQSLYEVVYVHWNGQLKWCHSEGID